MANEMLRETYAKAAEGRSGRGKRRSKKASFYHRPERKKSSSSMM